MAATYGPMSSTSFPQPQWDRAVPHYEDAYDPDLHENYGQTRDGGRRLNGRRSPEFRLGEFDIEGQDQRRESADRSQGDSEDAGLGRSEGSAWIHRDKLARIESREMQEAGILPRRSSQQTDSRPGSRAASRSASRSASRNGRRRTRSRDPHMSTHDYEDAHAEPLPEDAQRRVKAASPMLPSTDDSDVGTDGATDPEIRTSSREAAAAARFTPQYSQPIHRPPTSRIPISRHSPAPTSHSTVERDSPVSRNYNTSTAWASSPKDTMIYQKHRPRSQSMGTHAVLDDTGIPRAKTPSRSRPASSHYQQSPYVESSPASPPRVKTPGSQPVGRKTGSRVVSQPRSRHGSGTIKDLPARKTSNGRPKSAINRPEGDAPWLATMYKPDPMLPPEQQMLPTLAKRKMQEQWEKEGKVGDTYDLNFDLPNDNDPSRRQPTIEPQVEKPPSPDKEYASPRPTWPLDSPMLSSSSRQGSTAGGYRITPTIPPNQQIHALATQRQNAMSRMQEVDEKEAPKKKSGCGCCIVM